MTKETIIKIALIAGALLFVVGLIIVIKLQLDLKEKQEAIEKSMIAMKQLDDNIVRSESSYADKETLEKFAKDLGFKLEAIEDDLDKLNSSVKAINNISVISSGFKGTNLPSSSLGQPSPTPIPDFIPCESGICANPDKFGYLNKAQNLSLNEPFTSTNVPFGSTTFKAWEEKPWSLEIFPREYNVTTVLAQDEDGRHTAYSKFAIKVNNKIYDVPIKSAKLIEQYPESEFRFSPRLFLGVALGVNVRNPRLEFLPDLSLGFFSYGKTKIQPDITILHAGVGAHVNGETVLPAFSITPLTYNVGQHIPFMQNFYLGPNISVDTGGGVAVTAGFKVGL